MYFPDMGQRTPFTEASCVRAVGWLDATHTFTKGHVDDEARERIRAFSRACLSSMVALRWPAAAGFHTCELCGDVRAGGNFGVPDGEVIFVCPQMIAHYVDAHEYHPPPEFIRAILSADLPGTEAYESAAARFHDLRA